MKKIYLSLAILAGIGLAGCNDSFLEHAPVTSLTENNAFRSYDNFKSFAWPCYEIFKDNNIANTINGTGQGSCYAGDMNAGYLESRANESGNDYAFGRVQSVASGNGWGFSGTFRRANILLANIDKSEMTDAEKDHWRAVGYFSIHTGTWSLSIVLGRCLGLIRPLTKILLRLTVPVLTAKLWPIPY